MLVWCLVVPEWWSISGVSVYQLLLLIVLLGTPAVSWKSPGTDRDLALLWSPHHPAPPNSPPWSLEEFICFLIRSRSAWKEKIGFPHCCPVKVVCNRICLCHFSGDILKRNKTCFIFRLQLLQAGFNWGLNMEISGVLMSSQLTCWQWLCEWMIEVILGYENRIY